MKTGLWTWRRPSHVTLHFPQEARVSSWCVASVPRSNLRVTRKTSPNAHRSPAPAPLKPRLSCPRLQDLCCRPHSRT